MFNLSHTIYAQFEGPPFAFKSLAGLGLGEEVPLFSSAIRGDLVGSLENSERTQKTTNSLKLKEEVEPSVPVVVETGSILWWLSSGQAFLTKRVLWAFIIRVN